MKVAGIVSEYNPFHFGHKYHIEKTRKELNCDCIIAIMSSNFTQRGDVAIINMEDRAKFAIKNGIDLVLSIPPQFVLQSAQYYAYNSVFILNSLSNVDYISFGSESGNIDVLKSQIDITTDLHENLKSGMTYAKAVSSSDILSTPNNTLGVEYLRALKKLNSKIEPFTISRNKVEHNSEIEVDNFASASYIRSLIKNGEDVSKLLPYNIDDLDIKTDNKIAMLLNYRLNLGDEFDFENFANISEGLNNRIIKYKNSKSLREFIDNIKCKRYTETRIRRALYSILLDIKKDDIALPPNYTRVLAMNETGQQFLSSIRKTKEINVISNLTKKEVYNNNQLQKELIINEIYNML